MTIKLKRRKKKPVTKKTFKFNTEVGFITELLVSKDLVTAVDNQIGSKFLSGTNKNIYKFIKEHSSKYGQVPSIGAFKKKFPDFALASVDGNIGTGESVRYWCDELRHKYKHNLMVDNLEEIYKNMEDGNTDDAYKTFKNIVEVVESQVILTGKLELNRDTKKRKEAYMKRKKSGGLTGLPSGFDHWDRITGGANKGELTVIMGFTGIGKSWWLIIQAVNLVKMGYKVVFFTTEMTKEMVMRRVDAVWCALNYSDFTKGQLKADQEKRYFQYLEEIEGDLEHQLVIEQVTEGVTQIGTKIDQYKPDKVFVDGAYLLADEDDDQNWLATIKVFRGLHNLSISKNIPIEATTQSKDETGATLKSLQFARALAQECDVVGVLEQDEQMKNDREIKLKPLKLREGSLLSNVYLHWDFDEMNYKTIFSEERKKDENSKAEAEGVIDVT